MKILYASCRVDPSDRDAGSGEDFNIFEVFAKHGMDLKIVGPFKDRPSFLERIYRKGHRLFSRKNTAKFSVAYLRSSARAVEKAVKEFQPDAIFTHNLVPLVYLRATVPVVYNSDAFMVNTYKQWPTSSIFEYYRMLNWEKKAVKKSSLIICTSLWAEEVLLNYYRFPKSRVLMFPIPSSLPYSVVPKKIQEKGYPMDELHLLTVGRDYQRKGIDITLKVLSLLKEHGVKAKLRVVGLQGESTKEFQYMGLFKKKDPKELSRYVEQYHWADLLIHPARYEAAGIVCSEAAAFGVPTITNASGGLATTVQDGISGIVLPMESPAEAYVEAILNLISDPKRFKQLRRSTRERYERELNWDVAGNRILKEIDHLLQM
jgi:glycosyltransferase involved in cell wall biosynthesis